MPLPAPGVIGEAVYLDGEPPIRISKINTRNKPPFVIPDDELPLGPWEAGAAQKAFESDLENAFG